jgi:4-hydroxy-tetrahydrodipicolinate synthase
MPSSAVPDALVLIYHDFRNGRVDEARKRYGQILPLLNLEMSVQMAVSKEVLRRRGIFSAVTMRDPEFVDLDRGDISELDAMWPGLERAFNPALGRSGLANVRRGCAT